MNRAKRPAIFSTPRATDPSPTTEPGFSSSFELLIAAILSAQARGVSVNKATRKLFADARTGIRKCKLPLEVKKRLLRLVPVVFLQHAHHRLVLHGRYVCKARKALCSGCGIESWHEFRREVFE